MCTFCDIKTLPMNSIEQASRSSLDEAESESRFTVSVEVTTTCPVKSQGTIYLLGQVKRPKLVRHLHKWHLLGTDGDRIVIMLSSHIWRNCTNICHASLFFVVLSGFSFNLC